jgi:uncharacterized protein YjbI with pentapeptide repeats
MKIAISLVYTVIVLSGIILIPNAFAENVPDWVKNNAGWWATDQIDDSSFLQGIQYLIKEGIMVIPPTETSESTGSQGVPSWIKNNAGWWADGQIDDSSFVLGMQWLISNGIIKISEECVFEDKEYTHLSSEDRKRLCDDFNFNFVTERIHTSKVTATYNSEGFRGPEFLKEKPDKTYRIFVIGGSTTFGDRNADNKTWPYYLHEIFDTLDLNYDVEIINAGFSSGWSGSETKLIREKILDYNPDLLMIYDGWNDVRMQLGEPQGRIAKPEMANPTLWKDVWIESCELANANNVKTIVTLQPFLGTGSRILSNQEQAAYVSHSYWVNNDIREYTKYQNQLEEISKYCTETKDLTGIFDQVDKPIYWDLGHVGSEGNKIIATHFFKLALPYIPGNERIMPSEIVSLFLEESSTKSQQISSELDLRGKNFVNEDFTNQDLRESVFHISNFKNVDFSNTELENADFGFTTINGGNFNGADLKNALFPRTLINFSDFSSADLANVDLSTAIIGHTKFINANLSNSEFSGAFLYNIDFDNVNLENSVFDNSLIIHTDIKNADKIKNLEIRFADIYNADFNGMDFSEIVFGPQNAFAGCDFRNSNLPMVQLGETDFSTKFLQVTADNEEVFRGSNLSNLDFSNTDMSGVVLSHVSNFPESFQESTDIRIQARNMQSVDLTGANLSGANLSGKNLTLVIFYGTHLPNADLSGTDLRYADLRNADLSGADLTNANLEFADLHGAILDNTILKCLNHPICLND